MKAIRPALRHGLRLCVRILLLAHLTILFSIGVASADQWTTAYQGNAAHTGYISGSLNSTAFKQVWSQSYATSGPYHLQPIVADSNRVFLAIDSYFNKPEALFAYDAATGNQAWSVSISDPMGLPGMSAPAYANGNVYVTVSGYGATLPPSSPAAYYAFSAASGAQIYKSTFISQGDAFGGPTAIGNQIISDSGYYGGVTALNANSGAVNWMINFPQEHGWSAAADAIDAYVYLPQGGPEVGTFYAINNATGHIDYTIQNPSSDENYAFTNPLLGEQHDAFTVSVGYHTHNLVRFDLIAHSISWQIGGISFLPGMALHGGQLYDVNNNVLEARDESTGALLWSWVPPVGQTLASNIVVSDSRLLVASMSKTFLVDLTTHIGVAVANAGGNQIALSDQWFYVEYISPVSPGTSTLTAFQVPEPSSAALFAAAVGPLALWRCRGRKRRAGL